MTHYNVQLKVRSRSLLQ